MQKNEKLIRNLQDINPELASFYESAYQTLVHASIPNKLQTSAYCLRELLCRLPNHFDNSLIKPNKKISTKISPMIELWEKLSIKNCLDISSEAQWESEKISAIKVFLNQFNQLVETDREIQKARKEYAIQFIHRQNEKYSLEHLPDNHMDYLGKIFYEFLDFFNKVLHGPNLGINENEFKENFTNLESYLIGILEPDVTETHTKIDAILEKKKRPDVNLVNSAMALIHNKVSYDYFFKRLNSPIWLEPLKNAGVFNNPPNTMSGFVFRHGGLVVI